MRNTITIDVESFAQKWRKETVRFRETQDITISVKNFRSVFKTDSANPQAAQMARTSITNISRFGTTYS